MGVFEELFEEIKTMKKEIFKLRQELKVKETEPQFGDINMAIKITGLSRSTIFSLIKDRSIPHKKVNKRLVFERRELGKWMMEDCHVKTAKEIEAEV